MQGHIRTLPDMVYICSLPQGPKISLFLLYDALFQRYSLFQCVTLRLIFVLFLHHLKKKKIGRAGGFYFYILFWAKVIINKPSRLGVPRYVCHIRLQLA